MCKTIRLYWLLPALAVLLLTACSNNEEMIELQDYVLQQVNRPPGLIDPIPAFSSYEPFQYSASSLRGPFEIPLDITQIIRNQNNDVSPDENRPTEQLENYAINSLEMVGTITRNDVYWALILDETGLVSRATVGNYMGRNHGRIIDISEGQIELIEIVPQGDGFWTERPQTITLQGSE
ncbi:MAG: pilus assembly protein PilP [Gammaproteobacteria bacterium]|nr:pilus assembly protein PilP [Gammaproteobacteria bacterium]